MSRNVPSRCIFFLRTRSAELMSLSRTKTCMPGCASPVMCPALEMCPWDLPRGPRRGWSADGAAGSRGPAPLPQGSGLLQIDRGGLALVAALELEAHALALNEMPEARPLDGRDMHEHVLRAVLRLDESVAFLGIEPLHGSDRHCRRRPSHKKLPPLEMERRSRTTTLNGQQVRRSMRVEEQAERCRS